MFALLSAFAINAAAVEYEEHDYNDGDVEIWDQGDVSINGRVTAACVNKHTEELETKRVVVVKKNWDGSHFEPPTSMTKYFCEVAEKVAEKDYYLPSGKLKEERYYKNGKLDGVRRKYYEDGKLRHESSYKNGEQDGYNRGYHENGKMSWEWFRQDGEKEGVEKDYYETGTLRLETPYKAGKKEGTKKWYDKKGRLKKTVEYKSSEAISGACYATNGKATSFTQEQITKENSEDETVDCP
jgi:antitoxin component YwqK of YwqJK toxin-antitoxin module